MTEATWHACMLVVLSLIGGGLLRSPPVIADLFLSSLVSVHFMHLAALMFIVYVYNCYVSLMNWPSHHYITSFIVS